MIPVADVGPTTQLDLAKGRADVVRQDSEFLAVKMDGGYRSVTARCPKCSEKQEIHQTQQQDGNWSPDFGNCIAKFGWQHNGEHAFCSHMCLNRYARQRESMAGAPVPVMSVNDASYAKKFYADPVSRPASAGQQSLAKPK